MVGQAFSAPRSEGSGRTFWTEALKLVRGWMWVLVFLRVEWEIEKEKQ